MSDIAKARQLLHEAQALYEHAARLQAAGTERVRAALLLMTRESPVRRSKAQRVLIDSEVRAHVHRLALNHDLSMADIAAIVGVGSQGRVSEILSGRR